MKRILVVDDDTLTRRLLNSVFTNAGYQVTEAADGAAALTETRKGQTDLVFLDVWMPVMNGLELLARLKEEEHRPRVVVMTTDDTPATVLNAIRQQAYRYTMKPLAARDLLEIAQEAFAEKPGVPPIEVVSAKPHWVELLVPCELHAAERIQEFMQRLKGDLPHDVRETVGMAFRELLMNAIEWGGKLDPNSKVRISYLRARRMLLFRIADPGQGFSFENLEHSALNNPDDQPFVHTDIREEKGIRPGGFGLLMTKHLVDELVYNEAQNEVVFVKYLD